MSTLFRRQSTLIVNSNSKPDAWGASYTVTAFEVGAQVASTSSGTTITVRAGHGFAASDKILKNPGSDDTFSGTNEVASVTATTVVMDSAFAVTAGDILVNLGADTGTSTPNYDASGVTIYSDMDGTTAVTNSRVTADAQGGYGYWTKNRRIWELVRDSSGSPVENIPDIFNDPQTESIYNVLDFGATGDGSTDDATAIQAAIDAAEADGGGVVWMPQGTYIIDATLTVGNGVILRGASHVATVLKAKNSLNADVIRSENFATLTGQNKWLTSDNVNHGLGFEDFAIDGNKANQTSGNGMSLYAKRYHVTRVQIYDCDDVGFFSEAGDVGGQTDQTDMPESSIGPLWVRNCDSHGIQYRGPHDGVFTFVACSENGGDGMRIEFSSGVYSGTCDIQFAHLYASTVQGLFTNAFIRADFLIVESNGDEGIEIDAATGNCQIGELHAFKNDQDSAGKYNVLLEGTYNQIGIVRVQDDQGGGGISITGNGNMIGMAHIEGQETTGTGLSIDSNQNFIGGGVIRDYTGVGGVGLVTNATGSRNQNQVRANITNCATCFNQANAGSNRNIYDININAAAGQTVFSGSAPDIEESWHVLGRDSGGTNYLSVARGTGSILSGNTSVTITHNLLATPSVDDITITLNEQGTNDPGNIWVDTITSTQFNVNCRNDPGASNLDFGWRAHI